MAKNKRRMPGLVKGMLIYAVVFLALAACALTLFWDFIAAYEVSRPKGTIDAYIEQLTDERLCANAADVIGQVDTNIQSEEECNELILASVADGITYAKKSSESDDHQTVYMLRSGSRVIGSVTMTTAEVDQYGFSRWQISEEEYDFSYLLGAPVSITVPSDYRVYINGVQLDSGYITQEGIEYEALDVFYGDYQLPTMVTYQAGPFLGEFAPQVTDPAGNPVTIDETTDYNVFLNNCTEEEIAELTAFMNTFLERYVAFTGSAHKSSERSFGQLLNYVVIGSDLHTRMLLALDGLAWAQSRGDRVVSLTANRFVNIGDGKYLCDATYEVDTTGREGVVRTTNHVKFIIVVTADGMKVETLVSY